MLGHALPGFEPRGGQLGVGVGVAVVVSVVARQEQADERRFSELAQA